MNSMSLKPSNAVIYARYSGYGQQEQSITGQLRDCYAYAKREGLKVVGEYIDRSMTGRNDDRPDFQRMLKDAEKKQFQHVIVWKLDRFARNRFDSAINKAALKKHGVSVLSATEMISNEPEGILLEGLIESIAEYFSENLSKHVKRGQRESILRGSHLGGTPPFGFRSVRDGDRLRLVADEKNAPILRYVFEQYAKGVSKKDILAELSKKGMVNAKGGSLTFSSLQKVLRNKKYIGIFMHDGEIIEGACDKIIDEDVFQKVQDILDSRSHGKNEKRVRESYLLHGKAFCGLCGTKMVGDCGRSKTGAVHSYYSCGKRKKQRCCEKKAEKKEFIEWYVVEQTILYVLNPEHMDYIADRIVNQYNNDFNDTQIRELKRTIKRLDSEVETLIDEILDSPKTVRGKLKERIDLLEIQKADIEQNLTTMVIANSRRLTKKEIIDWLKSFCTGDLLDVDFQKRIIDVLVNAVFLFDDKVVIYYNVENGQQISYIEMIDSEGNDAVAGSSSDTLSSMTKSSSSEYHGVPTAP